MVDDGRLAELELDARDIALHFGHQDGGELGAKLYGDPTRRSPARVCARRSGRHGPRPFRWLHL